MIIVIEAEDGIERLIDVATPTEKDEDHLCWYVETTRQLILAEADSEHYWPDGVDIGTLVCQRLRDVGFLAVPVPSFVRMDFTDDVFPVGPKPE